MEAKNIMSDTLMVTELAQELGISPLDLFMYWINTGEIKNVSVSVVFQNEEEIKVDFCKDTIEEIINQSSTKPVNQTSTYEEEKKELLGLVKLIKVDETNQSVIEDLIAMLEL